MGPNAPSIQSTFYDMSCWSKNDGLKCQNVGYLGQWLTRGDNKKPSCQILHYLYTKTPILGQVVHISWLLLQFSNKMAAILDLTTKYLTYRFHVVFMLILDFINLHLNTKTIILGKSVHISWLLLLFSYKMAAILDFSLVGSLRQGSNDFLVIFLI